MKIDELSEVSLEDISRPVFDLDPRRYRQLSKEFSDPAGEIYIPEPQRGKIDFVRASKGLIAYYRKSAEGGGSISQADARTKLIEVQRELKQFQLEREQGLWIPRDEVLGEFLRRIAIVKSGLLSLPRSLPGRLNGKDPRETGQVIRRAVITLLEKFSRKGGVLK